MIVAIVSCSCSSVSMKRVQLGPGRLITEYIKDDLYSELRPKTKETPYASMPSEFAKYNY